MRATKSIIGVLGLGLLTALPASGQYRVGDDGRTLDANNRIGSGGYNDGGQQRPGVTGNQIVTGNVTGGREFRDRIGYTDPGAFRGPSAGVGRDRFVRDSSAAPVGNQPAVDLTRPQPFYGVSRAAPPPPGYVQAGPSGGYVPAPPPQRNLVDTRLGAPLEAPSAVLPSPGELMLPGPVDATSSSIYTASPLYGIRQWRTDDPSDRYFLSNYTNLRYGSSLNRTPLNERQIEQMRQELERTIVAPEEQGQGSAPLDSALNQPAGSPDNDSLAGAALSSQTISGEVRTSQGVRQRLLIPPSEQSAQYAELQRRLERFNANRTLTDIEASQQYNQQLRVLEESRAAAARKAQQQRDNENQQKKPDTAAPQPEGISGPTDSGSVAERIRRRTAAQQQRKAPPAEPQLPATLPAAGERPAPLKIKSLAEGVSAEGLRNVLVQAEQLMKQGKFTSALDQYDIAEQAAPNNSMIFMGRANAELGAGYYTRAEAHLRQAFVADQSLLMGQYDLRSFLGEDRITFLVNDLKEIANSDTKQARPMFLLAYIAYNTGNEARASDYLKAAEERGGKDPVIDLLRRHWALPQSVLNK